MYLCEYEYDEAWKRFRKRRYRDEGAAAADGGGGGNCPMTPAGMGDQECVWDMVVAGC